MNSTLTLDAPETLLRVLGEGSKQSRRALESITAQEYVEGNLTHAQVAEILGLSRWETDAFLKAKQAFRASDVDEFADDADRLRASLNS
jgi:hypothetical protein